MNKKDSGGKLGARERQIMNIMFELGEASISDVHRKLVDPPSYSAVRSMVRLLESKGLLKQVRREGTKYIYKPTQSRNVASKSALKQVMKTFFAGSPSDAVAAIFKSERLTGDDLERIEKLIDEARKEGR